MSFEKMARCQLSTNMRRIWDLDCNNLWVSDPCFNNWGEAQKEISFLESENARLERYLEDHGERDRREDPAGAG